MLRILIAATIVLAALNGGVATQSLASLLGLPTDYVVAGLIALGLTPLVAPWFH